MNLNTARCIPYGFNHPVLADKLCHISVTSLLTPYGLYHFTLGDFSLICVLNLMSYVFTTYFRVYVLRFLVLPTIHFKP